MYRFFRCVGGHYDSAGRYEDAQTLVGEILRINPGLTTDILSSKSAMVAVLLPDTGFPENYALTGYENHVTASGLAWSNRATARRLGVSPGMVATTRKRLSVEAAQADRVQHLGGRP